MERRVIKAWLTYWKNANMVNLSEIKSVLDCVQARRFCSCMRVGVFTDVATSDIWNALVELRGDGKC